MLAPTSIHKVFSTLVMGLSLLVTTACNQEPQDQQSLEVAQIREFIMSLEEGEQEDGNGLPTPSSDENNDDGINENVIVPCHPMGDVIGDENVDILDVIATVNLVLDSASAHDNVCADLNGDTILNIQDVIILLDIILEIPVDGCTDSSACNYNPDATDNDGSCQYPEEYYACDGTCINDSDGDEVCDENEISGCLEMDACNYDANTTDEVECVYPEAPYDCDGECVNDVDDNGICDEDSLENFAASCDDNLQCFFLKKVWKPFMSSKCLSCHKAGGLAGDFTWTLINSTKPADVETNIQTLSWYVWGSIENEADWPYLLTKPINQRESTNGEAIYTWDFINSTSDTPGFVQLSGDGWPGDDYHMGGTILDKDDSNFENLKTLAQLLLDGTDFSTPWTDVVYNPYEHVDVLETESEKALRRIEQTLLGRLPNTEEIDTMYENGLQASVDAMLDDDAFLTTLKRWYEDLFLVNDYNRTSSTKTFCSTAITTGRALRLLGGNGSDDNDYFPNRYWPLRTPAQDTCDVNEEDQEDQESVDLSNTVSDEVLALFSDPHSTAATSVLMRSNRAIAQEALDLISYVVNNNNPLTDILTADYTVVNPFSAVVYNAQGRFTNLAEMSAQDFVDQLEELGFDMPDDCIDLVDGGCDNLKDDDFIEIQVERANSDGAALGVMHAGVLSAPIFLARQPTDGGNRNRHRAYNFFKNFRGLDLFEDFQEPPLDFASGSVTENSSCTSCHRNHDAIAAGFRDFDNDGRYRPSHLGGAEGWYTNQFPQGFAGNTMDMAEENPLRWLATEVTEAQDGQEGFAKATVEQLYKQLFGEDLLKLPKDSQAPNYAQDFARYSQQEEQLNSWKTFFIENVFDIKALIKEMVLSDAFLTAGLSNDFCSVYPTDEESCAELAAATAGLGVSYMLSPEQLSTKVAERLDVSISLSSYWTLYGGINSQYLHGVTKRNGDATGLKYNIAVKMADEAACKATAKGLSSDNGRLFSSFELPASEPESLNALEADIRAEIQHLFAYLLGEELNSDDEAVNAAYTLFAEVWQMLADANDTGLSENCRHEEISNDETHMVKAWMAVLSYMLRDYKFLYVN
ncbi:MAG: hypothetical protein CMH60_03965 [Myxococcales bacterium]|nr:hypothetical protein [Myxococcales bacterium]